jgi:nucleoside-diphosphate-sugar epimerase
MAVTVVGAEGFIGRRLAARLRARGQAPWTPAKGDPALLSRDLGLVFYCAGLTADYDRRPFDTVAAHAGLLSELVRADRFERIVYLSSTRLYDGLAKPQVAEDEALVFDPADPRRTYDLSKALGENLVLTRAGGRGAVARLANVYDAAPGSPGFLSEWLARAASAKALALDSSPHVARDYIHLHDTVEALVAIADAADGGVWNVASGALATNGAIAAVFEAQGWRVSFAADARPAPPPVTAIARLRALGVAARAGEGVGRGDLGGG